MRLVCPKGGLIGSLVSPEDLGAGVKPWSPAGKAVPAYWITSCCAWNSMPITWKSWWRSARRPIWRRSAKLRPCSTKFYPSKTFVPFSKNVLVFYLIYLLRICLQPWEPYCVTSCHSKPSGYRLNALALSPNGMCCLSASSPSFLGHCPSSPLSERVYVG